MFVDVLVIRSERHGFAETVAQSKGLDTVTLYIDGRTVEGLSFCAALGYVETPREVEDGQERVYLRETILIP